MSKVSTIEQAMVFSMSTDADLFIAPNFQVKEFACSDGSDVVLIHPFIPHICQIIRNKFNMPFTPDCAYRTVTYNESVDGASNSNHIYGRAVDIPAYGVAPIELYHYLDTIFGDWGEIGLYNWGIHVGVQDKKERFIDSEYEG